ncbi:MAG: hypothetical protein WDO18_08690 [Acidobacteriota bacterium]
MGRPKMLGDRTNAHDLISATSYNPMGELTSMTGANGAPSESPTYNSIGAMRH